MGKVVSKFPMSVDFIKELRSIKDLSLKYYEMTGIDYHIFPAITLLENGYGQYPLVDRSTKEWAFNPLGIKGSSLHGFITVNSYEYSPGFAYSAKVHFRKYLSYSECFDDALFLIRTFFPSALSFRSVPVRFMEEMLRGPCKWSTSSSYLKDFRRAVKLV
jgi:flagellum-specific peptidoglycan hydrolase FlgJ